MHIHRPKLCVRKRSNQVQAVQVLPEQRKSVPGKTPVPKMLIPGRAPENLTLNDVKKLQYILLKATETSEIPLVIPTGARTQPAINFSVFSVRTYPC